MLAAKRAAGEPLPERKYTHATKPKPTFLKKFSAAKLPQNAAQQTAKASNGVTTPPSGHQHAADQHQKPGAVPVAPASPDSVAAKPASIAAQDSISSAESKDQLQNGLAAVERPSEQQTLRGSRKALFAQEDRQEPIPLIETGTLFSWPRICHNNSSSFHAAMSESILHVMHCTVDPLLPLPHIHAEVWFELHASNVSIALCLGSLTCNCLGRPLCLPSRK